jgi:hypothetical protein
MTAAPVWPARGNIRDDIQIVLCVRIVRVRDAVRARRPGGRGEPGADDGRLRELMRRFPDELALAVPLS